jgi:hypothetical protein
MNRLFLIFLALLGSALSIAAQTAANNCPEVIVIGPNGVTRAGDALTFTASVANAGQNSNLEYDWTVTEGTIESGQGTAAINVRTTPEMAGTNVTATVKVRGLTAGCVDTASESTGVAQDPVCQCSVDEFGMLSRDDVKARIDNFYIRLQNDPEIKGFIIVHFNEKENRALQKRFLNSIYDAIVFLKKDPSRVTFLISVDGHETNATLYLVPVGINPPPIVEFPMLIRGEEFRLKIKTLFSKTN